MHINCLSLENGTIHGLPPDVPLAQIEGDEVMVCDFDAIKKGKFNFRLYGEISKFVEAVVVNLPSRVEDVMDTLISGASKVVLASDIEIDSMRRMLGISDGIVLPSRSPAKELYYTEGGRYLISDHEEFTRFDLCYNVGPELSSKKYINVRNFPENLMAFI